MKKKIEMKRNINYDCTRAILPKSYGVVRIRELLDTTSVE